MSFEEEALIRALAEKYGASKVLLFGSNLDSAIEPRDLDLGVVGLSPYHFFRFYGELLISVSLPVDLVDLSQNSEMSSLISERSAVLYVRN